MTNTKELKKIHDHFEMHLKEHPAHEELYSPYTMLGTARKFVKQEELEEAK